MASNASVIEQALKQALKEQDYSGATQELQKVIQELRAYIDRLEWISQAIASEVESVANIVQNSNLNTSEIAMRYWAMKELQKREGDVSEILKQGYIYMEHIRKAVTGQETEYLVATKRYGKIVEGKATLTEILESASLAIETRAEYQDMLKLRLTRQPEVLKNGGAEETIIADSVAQSSSVFSAVYNYFSASHGNTPKVNKGNAYETYRLILAQRQGNNKVPPPLTIETIEQAYSSVKGNTLAFYKGGDIGTVQVKYFGGAAPSLVTIKTLKDKLPKIITLFEDIVNQSKPNRKIASAFADLFLSKESQVTNELDKEARDEAIENINKMFGTSFRLTPDIAL